MIELMENLCITADRNQYILGKMRQRTGEARVEVVDPQYFATIDVAVKAAISRILRGKVQDGQITSLNAFLVEHAHLVEDVQRVLGAVAT